MNKTTFPKTGVGAAGMREGSIFPELDWWQQGLMRQGLESGSLSQISPLRGWLELMLRALLCSWDLHSLVTQVLKKQFLCQDHMWLIRDSAGLLL